VVSPVTGKAETLNGVAAVRFNQTRLAVIGDILGGKRDPRTDAGRKALLRAVLDMDPDWTKRQTERAGVGSPDELVAGSWTFKAAGGGKQLEATLLRNDYTIMRPVVDPSTETLYMNVFPAKPRTDAFQLIESDDRFFGSA
jgi:hypothetical protein